VDSGRVGTGPGYGRIHPAAETEDEKTDAPASCLHLLPRGHSGTDVRRRHRSVLADRLDTESRRTFQPWPYRELPGGGRSSPNSTSYPLVNRRHLVRSMLGSNIAIALFSLGSLFNAYTQSEAPCASQPEPIPNRYVDRKLCAGCHPGISRSYGQTGMGRSFYRPLPSNTVEDYSNHNQ
jgi:hypothetical protein